MRAMLEEYGLILIAMTGVGVLLWAIVWVPKQFKSFSAQFIQTITGVSSAEYNESPSLGGE